MNQVYGWLLLTPAAILLISFTYYPAVATLGQSFFSAGTALKPSVFVGVENYRSMLDDEVFWQVLKNNLWYAAGTIPASIAIALLMAVWVNGKLPLRGFIRMSYFTPTVLPMIAVANIWLFFYTPGHRGDRSDCQLPGPANLQLVGRPGHSAGLHHHYDDLERSRIFHDLLSGGAAIATSGT